MNNLEYEELSDDQLDGVRAGILGRIQCFFENAVIQGMDEIEGNAGKGTLSDRFMTPITHIGGGGTGVWSQPGHEAYSDPMASN
jgi:hypothetical protein